MPLLLDLNEILNLDVIAMAMKEQESRKSRRKQRKVLPETDEQSDPTVYVEERLSFQSAATVEEEKSHGDGDSNSINLENLGEGLGAAFYIDIETQVVPKLRRG